MALKTQINAEELDQMPEALREFYVESDESGKFDLSTDSDDRLTEFRANNRTLFREVEELKKAHADQSSALQSAKEEAQKRTEKDLLSEGKIDELLAQRTEAMRGSYEEKLGEITRAHTEAEKTLDVHIVENQIRDAAIKAQARNDRAVDHIIRAVRPHVQRDGTQAVRIDSSGNTVMAEDGKTPQGILDLVAEMKVSDGFLFAESTGSGASGGDATNGATGKKRIRRSEIGKYINEVAAGDVEIVEG
jgi:seryl-tRNA synthetase